MPAADTPMLSPLFAFSRFRLPIDDYWRLISFAGFRCCFRRSFTPISAF